MNFGKYHVGKIPPYTVYWEYLLIKKRYTGFLHEVFGNPNCYFVYG